MKSLLLIVFLFSFVVHIFSQTELVFQQNISERISPGEIQHYKLKIQKGDFYNVEVMQNGIDLEIDLKDERTGKVETFDSPNGSWGPELVEFVAGMTGYQSIDVKPFVDTTNTSAKAGEYTIEYTVHKSAAEYNALLKQKEAEENEFVDWIKKNAFPLKSIKVGAGFEDLVSLKTILANKKVVGIGEATHGTKEFFQMKHRMLEFLVKEMGFTVFAIEASYSRCKYINDYVLTGQGNLDTATVIQGFTTWSTEEVRDMIKWMREYNSTNPMHKIQFVGFDLQVNDAAELEILNYYKKVDSTKLISIIPLMHNVLDAEYKGGVFSGDTSIRNLISPIEKLITSFIEKQGEYVLKTSKEEYDEVLWDQKILHQYLVSYSYNNFSAVVKKEDRDFYMAQNILCWLTYFPPGTKMMVWAHNGHIEKDYLDATTTPSMGSYLANQLKEDYYAIGFDFYKGKFQSNDPNLKDSPGWEEQEIGEAPEGNLSSYFVRAGLGNSFLDFSMTTKNKNIDTWLNEKQVGTYSMGSQFSKDWPSTNYIAPMKLGKAFDGMIFIKESTRAVPVPWMEIKNYNF